MNDRPILFSAPMVRAILDGRKTQTRRIVKPLSKRHPVVNLREQGVSGMRGKTLEQSYTGLHNDPDSWGFAGAEEDGDMPLSWWTSIGGAPGDRRWVRETWWAYDEKAIRDQEQDGVRYRADLNADQERDERSIRRGVKLEASDRWRPSIFMPRWASRITLEITGVRVERLQRINEADAIAEGVDSKPHEAAPEIIMWRDYKYREPRHFYGGSWGPKQSYRSLWESINGKDSWVANPWVWVIEFKRIDADA